MRSCLIADGHSKMKTCRYRHHRRAAVPGAVSAVIRSLIQNLIKSSRQDKPVRARTLLPELAAELKLLDIMARQITPSPFSRDAHSASAATHKGKSDARPFRRRYCLTPPPFTKFISHRH
ncbi:hypothetical protein O9992_20735 [Vibrio lentus]|nr:hypothetical protein [Vibrio lentus]